MPEERSGLPMGAARGPSGPGQRRLRSAALGALIVLLAAALGTAEAAAATLVSVEQPSAAQAASSAGWGDADACAAAAHAAGFRAEPLVTAVAVGLAESACLPLARGTNGPSAGCPWGSVDRGLWQINSCYNAEVSDACAYDGACNARAAYRMSSGGTRWAAWAAYTGGTYLSRLPAARAAVERLLHTPFGDVERIDRSVGAVVVSGWALDRDTAEPVTVHIQVDGAATTATTANLSRPDVGAAHPGYGNAHGFQALVNIGSGPHTICAYGINIGAGALNGVLGCRVFDASGSPMGAYGTRDHPGGLRFEGWAVDPDTGDPVDVHGYVGTVAAGGTAAGNRPDIAVAYPLAGPAHGFDGLVVPAGHGTHEACAYGINRPATPGGNALLDPGCRSVTLTGVPYGSYGATRTATGVRVDGWALDPDVADPVTVHIYVDGNHPATATQADDDRPDIAAAFRGYGARHGFDVTIGPLSPGPHLVCAYAINDERDAANAPMNPGCVSVTI